MNKAKRNSRFTNNKFEKHIQGKRPRLRDKKTNNLLNRNLVMQPLKSRLAWLDPANPHQLRSNLSSGQTSPHIRIAEHKIKLAHARG